MNDSDQAIAKRVEFTVFHLGYLFVRLLLKIRFAGRGIPKHQVLNFFVLKKYIDLCNKNSIRYVVFDGTL